jgi:hypothetical protein
MKNYSQKILKFLLSGCFIGAILIFGIQPALAFCGFYVAKADSSLYNQASQVIIARNENRTILTMSNDYQGDVQDFAMVVPVPVILKEEQVNISDAQIIQRLDAFSAPRLVEYFDRDPCQEMILQERGLQNAPLPAASEAKKSLADSNLGVTVEEQFSVGEYDIVILSAKESDGLETWLIQNGYKIPKGAKELLQPYIRQQLKFFVAKVNLQEYNKSGFAKLRPIAIAYESPKFMLPIRLGMMNAKGDQDLLVYLLSPQGQVQLTNYRTVKVNSDSEIPEFVKTEFTDFYKAMFQKAYETENKQVAFLEYAWDMSNCDPCAAEPLNQAELEKAGVFWLDSSPENTVASTNNVFITRLHIRYQRDKFPEDLRFQSTGDRTLFQGRYVIRHPFSGEITCSAAREYKQQVRNRQETEAQTLAKLTGWQLETIRDKIDFIEAKPTNWWRNIFK